jgi:ribokinase
MTKCAVIIAGEMNTDLVIDNLPHFPKAGELVNGQKLSIGPGGKSRNIAAMASTLMLPGSVAMISKTTRDAYGLWKVPLEDLQSTGVDTRFIQIVPSSETCMLPGIAVILVDQHGNNQIIGAPGITRDFMPADIDYADTLFTEVSKNHGRIAFTGCSPVATITHAMRKARSQNIDILFDPGGADDLKSLVPLLQEGLHLFKPNEHEAEAMAGVAVTDFSSARKAAHIFREFGVKNVLITAGAKGAYLFSSTVEKHIAAPQITGSTARDETGCGDQVMAALCALLHGSESLEQVTETAIFAGTLQFHKAGIQPVTSRELHALVR